MEWLKELLKKLGVEESKIDGIVGDVNKELPKHFVPKSQYNDLSDTKKKLETDLSERDKQLETLKVTAGASEDLKKQIETLQTENKTAKEKHEADLKELTLTNAVKTALVGKVHDETLAAGLIDRSKLVLDGDKVVGLDEQVKGLKETKAFLFKPEGPPNPNPNPNPNIIIGTPNPNPNPAPATTTLKDAISAHFQTKS